MARPQTARRSTVDGPWALSLTVSEEFLNAIAEDGIGAGVTVEPLRQTLSLPMLGDVDLTMGMTIIGVTFSMVAEHHGRLLASIRAAGSLELHGDSPLPSPPGRAIVRGDVLVTPVVEFLPDGGFRAVLDLPGSDLVGMHFEGFEGSETDNDTSAAMGQMLFATVGGEMFSGLASHMGVLGLELGAEEAGLLSLAGVRPAAGDIRVLDGRMVVGLPGVDGLDGHAEPASPGADGLGLGVADGAMAAVVVAASGLTLGVDLPVDLDFSSDQRGVGGRLRNRRLVQHRFVPDLRAGLRYTVATRLVGDRINVSLREAWIELPLVPPVVNQFSRVLGGAIGLAPLKFSLPSVFRLPTPGDGDDELVLTVSDLRGIDGGVTIGLDARVTR